MNELSENPSTLAPLIKSLDLSRNNFTQIPEELGRLSSVKIIILSNNKITLFETSQGDEFFKSWQKLEVLDLGHNQLKCIPSTPSWSYLKNLKKLILSSNKLAAVPIEVGLLKNLIEIDLSHNEIEEIPLTICALPDLELLDVSFNNISVVPMEISNLDKMIILRLGHNQIRTLPSEIFTKNDIKIIDYEGNIIQHDKVREIPGYEDYERRRKGRMDQLLK
ncbi:hypothetical protein MP638_004461 [Amoeboaphelidium occidentale]|nr:hypothetical protein MP638_004461 [Amoeboaphelidium occidentale]